MSSIHTTPAEVAAERAEPLLTAVDFSDCAVDVVTRGAALASSTGVELVLLHVVDPPAGVSGDTLFRPAPGDRPVRAIDFLTDDARTRLERFVALAAERGAQARFEVAVGAPVDAILQVASALRPGIIVMGTHGRRGVARWTLGSIAEDVLRASEFPVMTVRTQHKADCEARSCSWCDAHVTTAERRVAMEAHG